MKVKSSLISILDIGTTKIVCLIAYVGPDNNIKIVGVGHQVSQGFRAGIITDSRLAESAIIAAINAAEKMSGEIVDKLIVSVSGAQLHSHLLNAKINLGGDFVTAKDINRVINIALDKTAQTGQEIIHYFPLEYSTENASGIKDPNLIYASELGLKIHIISADSSAVLNLANCLARCQVDIGNFILSSYASGVACLSNDELELGVTLIDIGGATTDIAIFNQGNLIHTDQIPIGGIHLTSDIARGLSIDLATAERIKTLYGSALPNNFDNKKIIELSSSNDDKYHEPLSIEAKELSNIVFPRIEEIFELTKVRLEKRNYFRPLTKKIVLTGGTSQMTGFREYATHVFGSQVRIGAPKNTYGLTAEYKGVSFSSAIGMLELAAKHINKTTNINNRMNQGKVSYLKKLLKWF